MAITNFKGYRFVSVIVLIGLTTLAGCGGGKLKTNRVEGTVTQKGVPLAGADITFYPVGTGSTPAFGKTDEAGKYLLQTLAGEAEAGTTPGEYTVTVTKKTPVPTGRKLRGGENDELVYDETILKDTLPEKYASVQTTPFKAVVESKKVNTFDFELE